MMTVTILDIVAALLFLIDGVSRGVLEALHADGKVLEKKFKLDSFAFGGSQDWQRNYIGNRHKTDDGSINRHKPEWLGNFGRDAWHTFGDISKFSGRIGLVLLLIFASFNIVVLVKIVAVWLLGSLSEKITYDYLRK